jgi:hypothetical protein
VVGNIIRQLVPWLLPFVGAALATVGLRKITTGAARAIVTWIGAIASTILLAIFAGKAGGLMPQVSSDSPHARGVDVMKAALAITAMSLVLYEIRRIGERRPIAERWKKFVGITLGLAAIVLLFQRRPSWGIPSTITGWDQFHYYMGAKYFHELGYDDLYKCSDRRARRDRHGAVRQRGQRPKAPVRINMRAEVRQHDKKIRNLGGDNLLIPVDEHLRRARGLPQPVHARALEQYKEDVKFFRDLSAGTGKTTSTQMPQGPRVQSTPCLDHRGCSWATSTDEREVSQDPAASSAVHAVLGARSTCPLSGGRMFGALYWAFGWRTFAVAAVFWGTQSSAPFYWTGGAFLRQDWLFFFVVMAACFMRASAITCWPGPRWSTAGLLRVFPGLTVIGWLIVAAAS